MGAQLAQRTRDTDAGFMPATEPWRWPCCLPNARDSRTMARRSRDKLARTTACTLRITSRLIEILIPSSAHSPHLSSESSSLNCLAHDQSANASPAAAFIIDTHDRDAGVPTLRPTSPLRRSLYVLPRILTHLVVSWLVPPKQPRSSQSLMISNANHDFSQAHDPNSLPNRASLLARTRASRHVLRRLVVLSTLTYPFPRSRLAHPFLQTYRAASISVPMDVYGIRFRDHWAVTV